MTSEDSAAYLEAPRDQGKVVTAKVTPTGGVFVYRRDSVEISIASTECAGPDELTVSGPVNGGFVGNVCLGTQAPITLGPAECAGQVTFTLTNATYGSGSFIVSGSYPDYTVSLNDGYSDADYNDVVLQVACHCTDTTGDPVLDDSIFRQQALSELQASGTDGPPADRRERGGYVYQDSSGTLEIRINENAQATPCTNYPGGPAPEEGDSVIAAFHTHPFADGDTLPPACWNNGQQTVYDTDIHGGGSSEDWTFINSPYGTQYLPMYIIDEDEAFRLDPNTPPDEWAANPNRWVWNKTDCGWN